MAREKKLMEILATMDVPLMRVSTALSGSHRRASLRWLTRNLAVRNAEHPQLSEALGMVKDLMKTESQ
jgi:hypothetical protein